MKPAWSAQAGAPSSRTKAVRVGGCAQEPGRVADGAGVDNFGSSLFLPVALLYVTRVVGLPLAVAGMVVATGTIAGQAATVVPAVAGLLFMRANALAEAIAPAGVRGRYLAAFQYAFTVPGVIAPALFSVALWLPWLLAGACAGLAMMVLRWW
jgi:hypothetical protein